MRAKEYDVLEMAVGQGVTFGWSRAHKHIDKPEPEAIQDAIRDDVLNAICEWFDFERVPEAEEPRE